MTLRADGPARFEASMRAPFFAMVANGLWTVRDDKLKIRGFVRTTARRRYQINPRDWRDEVAWTGSYANRQRAGQALLKGPP